ncbi:hypothetical protein QBC39DRAFT_409549 [Podospora conica]|nr:hypothetical protein QBC39DRAFT_409549 [Schizothecium conicum]
MSSVAKPKSLDLRPKSFWRTFLVAQLLTKPVRITLTPETSLKGKTALLTGSTAGLGLLAASHLLSLDLSRLILAVRSQKKGEAVAETLRRDFPSATVDVWVLEMGSYDSIQALAKRAAAEFGQGSGKRLDIAILNAGVANQDFTLNKSTGHSDTIQTNFLSTFLLAILLLPVLRHKRPVDGAERATYTPGRLTIVSSGVIYLGKLKHRDKRPFLATFDDKTLFDPQTEYPDSKLLGAMFFVRLMEHLPAGLEDEVIFNLVDPGLCKGTDLHRSMYGVAAFVMSAFKTIFGRTLADGAWTYPDAVLTQGKESHGCFLIDWEIGPFAEIVYQPEGQKLMDDLWEETMAEYSFAGVNDVLESLKH